MKPAPIIGNARVLEYAVVGDAVFTRTLCLYVGGVRLGAVPCLAICESFRGDEMFLFHCDEDWTLRGIQAWKKSEVRGLGAVEGIKRRVEKYYSGISRKWIKHEASVEDAEAYKATIDVCCSFCSRSVFAVDSLVEGHGDARICDLCVMSFYDELCK